MVLLVVVDDLVPVVYLLANWIAPAHEGLELGTGNASVIKVLDETCGCNEAQIRKQYKVMREYYLFDLFLLIALNVYVYKSDFVL